MPYLVGQNFKCMPRKGRKPRSKIDKEEYDLIKPIDIFSLGTDGDPCFGKYHDLKAAECRECGDSEFCAIVMAQNLHKERLKLETTQRFKDLEDAEFDKDNQRRLIKNLISKYQSEGYPRLKIILLISKKLKVSKDIVKEAYDKLNS